MPNELWTPDGMRTLNREQTELTRKELRTLAELHEFAHNHNITIVCRKCDHALTGQNNDSTNVFVVKCLCREWTFHKLRQ